MGDRTPEQKAADEALTAAVNKAIEEYGYAEPGAINVQYVVVVEQRVWTEEYESTGVVMLYKDGAMPWVSILGLLKAAGLRTEAEFMNGSA